MNIFGRDVVTDTFKRGQRLFRKVFINVLFKTSYSESTRNKREYKFSLSNRDIQDHR